MAMEAGVGRGHGRCNSDIRYKTRACHLMISVGFCDSTSCTFAHRAEELSHLTYYKTELCQEYARKGNCNFRSLCRFAHGVREIKKPRELKKRRNLEAELYKTKLCRFFPACRTGSYCNFAHGRKELREVPTATLPTEGMKR